MLNRVIIAMLLAIFLTVLVVAQDETIYTPGEDGVTMPEILKQTTPGYTQEAIEARIQGVIYLQAVIRKSGRVDSFKVLRGLGYGLPEKAVQEIASNWRFRPGTLEGKPVDVLARIEVQFNLGTALMGVAANGQTSEVQALLDAGAKVNEEDDNDRTALMAAAQGGHTKTAQALLEAGADVNTTDANDRTALIWAAQKGHTETAQALLEAGADLKPWDRLYETTALGWAAAEGHTETVQALLDAGADVNAEDGYGETALMAAAQNNYLETAQALLDAGADVNAKNEDGLTALGWAAGHTEIVELLKKAGAKE